MKSYNGFSATQRQKAQNWLNEQWKAKRLERPHKCVSCTQDQGIIDAHAEDYTEPFEAGKTDKYHLCFRCHMMLHCRFRNLEAFSVYTQRVKDGLVFEPFFKRDFPTFAQQHFQDKNPPIMRASQETTNVLWEIHNANTPQE